MVRCRVRSIDATEQTSNAAGNCLISSAATESSDSLRSFSDPECRDLSALKRQQNAAAGERIDKCRGVAIAIKPRRAIVRPKRQGNCKPVPCTRAFCSFNGALFEINPFITLRSLPQFSTVRRKR